MHPKALLDAATELVRRVLLLDHPADTVVSRFFREQRALGPRERATLAETAYAVLRRKRLYEHLALSGRGARERRLAMLAFHAPRDFLKSALTDAEKAWIAATTCPTGWPRGCAISWVTSSTPWRWRCWKARHWICA